MKHKLGVVAIAGLAIVAIGAVVRPTALAPLARFAPETNSVIATVQQWVHQTATHLTTTQFVVCAGVTWCIFVVALVLLARSKRNMPREPKPQQESTTATPSPNAVSIYPARMLERSGPQAQDAPKGSLAAGDRTQYPGPTQSPIVMPAAPHRVVEQRVIPGSQPAHQFGMRDAPMVHRNRGHVLALTGLSLSADGRLVPYGIFVVAEDVGAPQVRSQASQRAIEIIAAQVVPSLTTQQVSESKQLTALLKMAVMHAGLELWRQGTRLGTGLAATLAGVIIYGDIAHIVNVGDCRTYLFRPRAGLSQITSGRGMVSGNAGAESTPVESGPVYTYPPRDEITRNVGSDALPTAVETFEVRIQPDDLLLLSSPGLWKALSQQEIETILGAALGPPSAAEILAHEGASRAREDGMNIIVVSLPRDRMPGFGLPAPRAGL